MAIKLENKQNVEAPSGPYPYGNIKDETGVNDGTPVDKAVYADFHQFFARLLYKSFVVPNGLPDNATNGFQYYEALENVINAYTSVNSYNVNTALTDSDFGTLSAMDVNGNADFTLPALSAGTALQKIKLMKLGTGVCQIIPFGSDIITPTEVIYLRDGDSVELVSFGFGWLVIEHFKRSDYPTNVYAAGTVNITQKELRCMNIINFSGNTTVNLPAIAASYAGQIIAFEKQQGGVATLALNGADTIVPNQTVTLEDGDTVVLMNVLGIHWMVISRFDASLFVPADIWHYVNSGGSEPPFLNGWINTFGGNSLAFIKDANGVVRMRGNITHTTYNATKQKIFTLPVGYRPTTQQFFALLLADYSDPGQMIPLVIDTNGDVSIANNTGAYGGALRVGVTLEFANF